MNRQRLVLVAALVPHADHRRTLDLHRRRRIRVAHRLPVRRRLVPQVVLARLRKRVLHVPFLARRILVDVRLARIPAPQQTVALVQIQVLRIQARRHVNLQRPAFDSLVVPHAHDLGGVALLRNLLRLPHSRDIAGVIARRIPVGDDAIGSGIGHHPFPIGCADVIASQIIELEISLAGWELSEQSSQLVHGSKRAVRGVQGVVVLRGSRGGHAILNHVIAADQRRGHTEVVAVRAVLVPGHVHVVPFAIQLDHVPRVSAAVGRAGDVDVLHTGLRQQHLVRQCEALAHACALKEHARRIVNGQRIIVRGIFTQPVVQCECLLIIALARTCAGAHDLLHLGVQFCAGRLVAWRLEGQAVAICIGNAELQEIPSLLRNHKRIGVARCRQHASAHGVIGVARVLQILPEEAVEEGIGRLAARSSDPPARLLPNLKRRGKQGDIGDRKILVQRPCGDRIFAVHNAADVFHRVSEAGELRLRQRGDGILRFFRAVRIRRSFRAARRLKRHARNKVPILRAANVRITPELLGQRLRLFLRQHFNRPEADIAYRELRTALPQLLRIEAELQPVLRRIIRFLRKRRIDNSIRLQRAQLLRFLCSLVDDAARFQAHVTLGEVNLLHRRLGGFLGRRLRGDLRGFRLRRWLLCRLLSGRLGGFRLRRRFLRFLRRLRGCRFHLLRSCGFLLRGFLRRDFSRCVIHSRCRRSLNRRSDRLLVRRKCDRSAQASQAAAHEQHQGQGPCKVPSDPFTHFPVLLRVL